MHNQDAVVAALSTPDAYDDAALAPVKHVQTHISHVFLTGAYAYKLKKDVRLSFLDFSTLESRRHYCEEELRLNRIFAPDLYCAVLPVVETGDSYRIGGKGDGPAVDYVVQMREFKPDDLLLEVFERGEFTESHAVEIGRKLAASHQKARVFRPGDGFGTADAVRAIVEENRELTEDTTGDIQSRDDFDRYHDWALSYIARHGNLIARRVGEGRIRECHGDLHLKNLCLYEGEIQFFDRIEFNDAFKNIDVLYDLAFLYMDLRFRGASHEANRLLNTYLERTGDYEGVVLMPLYASMRAYVRGMVASLLRKEDEVNDEDKKQAVEEGRAYFDHARSYARTGEGRLYAMCGLSGSGKSTVAHGIAQHVDAVHIRSDALRKHLAGVSLDERHPEIYTDAMTKRTYAELATLGCDVAEHGFPVVLDATYQQAPYREHVRREAASRGLRLTFVMTTAPESVLKHRLNERKGDVSDATAELLDTQRAAFDPIGSDEAPITLVVDTSERVDVPGLIERLPHAGEPA